MATLVLGRDGTEMRPLIKGAQSINELTSEQINDVVAYVRTWELLDPVNELLHRIPEPADTFNGKLLYASHCAGCHGINGKTEEVLSYAATRGLVVAPELNNKQFLTAATDGYLTATIIRGRLGTAMRPFGQGMQGMVDLKTQEIEEIVAYIRQWYVQPSPMIVETEVTYMKK
jgi:mono/diheme cytochrome c family protein